MDCRINSVPMLWPCSVGRRECCRRMPSRHVLHRRFAPICSRRIFTVVSVPAPWSVCPRVLGNLARVASPQDIKTGLVVVDPKTKADRGSSFVVSESLRSYRPTRLGDSSRGTRVSGSKRTFGASDRPVEEAQTVEVGFLELREPIPDNPDPWWRLAPFRNDLLRIPSSIRVKPSWQASSLVR